jgi:hypothetical protein
MEPEGSVLDCGHLRCDAMSECFGGTCCSTLQVHVGVFQETMILIPTAMRTSRQILG